MESINAREACEAIAAETGATEVTLFGEVLGVQDLMYGFNRGALGFRAFDVRIDGAYVDVDHFITLMEEYSIARVPVLYEGPFDYAKIRELSEGQSTIADHIREGVVIKPIKERTDQTVGRVILKFVGAQYLTRKGETTEFE